MAVASSLVGVPLPSTISKRTEEPVAPLKTERFRKPTPASPPVQYLSASRPTEKIINEIIKGKLGISPEWLGNRAVIQLCLRGRRRGKGLAEEVGFEPTVPFRVQRFSSSARLACQKLPSDYI